ncbi:hypothetical protein [Flavobacterium soyae]|uniref:Uncharacterized protein n=1 Tax=Flavobacterium soyae TaxID=2903098 RepID=A0ABZ2UBM8_9FLAO
MYTLYYLNRNFQLRTIETPTMDVPIRIPEELVFCNLRQGISFIREPHRCIDFTHTERLIMVSEFTDTELLKDADFRKENTYLSPLCQIEVYNFVLADADVKYFYDEGNVLIFPLNVGIPNMLTNVWLSYDGINWQRAGIEHDTNGFEWTGTENRLYYSAINGILFPSVDLVNAPFIDLPKYAFFENAETLGRSKVHTITIV